MDPASPGSRLRALVEVLLCSDIPTQMLSALVIRALGVAAPPDGTLRLDFIGPVLLLDTLLLIGLILLLLRLGGERPAPLFLGHRPWRRELRLGLPLAIGALALAALSLSLVRAWFPHLQTVVKNPFHDLVASSGDALLLAILGIVAGGVREEMQRAFVLRRFERHLGGAAVGLVVSSALFGVGHLLQGADTGIVTAVLGAYWGVAYLARRSIVAPVVSHALFNTVQVGGLLLAR